MLPDGLEPTFLTLRVCCHNQLGDGSKCAGCTGFEPVTSGLTVRCSTNRAHNPIYISNNFYLSRAPDGTRTRNGLSSTLLIKSQKRYHLRHGSVPLFYVCFRFRSGSQDQICFRFIILIITVWGRRDSNSHSLTCMRRIYSPLIFPATNYPNYISMNLCFFFQRLITYVISFHD